VKKPFDGYANNFILLKENGQRPSEKKTMHGCPIVNRGKGEIAKDPSSSDADADF